MSEIQQRIAALEEQLADLKMQVGGAPTEVLASRRDFAKKAALGVAGLAAAGVAGAVAAAGPASAIDTGNVVIGNHVQTAESLTALVYDGTTAPGGGFAVVDNAVDVGSSSYPACVNGWGYGTNTTFPGHINNGVYGFSYAPAGYAVVAWHNNAGTALLARGSGRANLELFSEGTSGPTRAGAHNKGEMVNDNNGDVWLCVVTGTPGIWRKVGGPNTAGQLHLTIPGRVYDSRADSAGKHTFGAADRVVTTTTVIAGQPAAGSVIVPAGAVGILANLTVTATEGAGFLGLYSNALATWPGNSSINWVAKDQDTGNSVTTAIDATGKIKVNIGGQGAATKTHFIIDVVGYYA